MDFEAAERRLAKDQSKFRSRQRQTRSALGLSVKAKREAELRRKKDLERKAARDLRRKRIDCAERYLSSIDRSLGVVRSLGGGGGGGGVASSSAAATTAAEADGAAAGGGSSWSSRKGLMLRPTSIHGDGDKIALPPSVLEALASRDDGTAMGGGGKGPLSFRIGILDPSYSFPASPALKERMEAIGLDDDDDDDGEADMDDDDDEADDADDGDVPRRTEAYLDELSRRYLSYTHAAVVEFTQEEGRVGLPRLASDALLDPKRRRGGEAASTIPATRTVDPAAAGSSSSSSDPNLRGVADDDDEEVAMDVDEGDVGGAPRTTAKDDDDDDDEKTPGHLAWGAFDVPDVDVEVTLISLPKGRKCTLVPTEEAVRNGFHGLKDVKLVLEQSLVRTRATLSLGDTVHAWHRGTKFDLRVSSVTPPDFGAVSCVDTDIEVDIGPSAERSASGDVAGNDGRAEPKPSSSEAAPSSSTFAPGVGRTLADDDGDKAAAATTTTTTPMPKSTTTTTAATVGPTSPPVLLPPEPPASQTEGVCDVRIRGDGSMGRRRFDVRTANLRDLFGFAASVVRGGGGGAGAGDDDAEGRARDFRLVTRFPRRVFALDGDDADADDVSLADAGIGAGQELFMVERT